MRLNKNEFALKKFTECERESFCNEVSILSQLQHPNIIKIVGYFEVPAPSDFRYVIVLPFLKGGSMAEWITSPKSPQEITQVFSNIMLGLSHLHSRGITHRDVNPQNVLFTDDLLPVLCDFNVSSMESSSLTSHGGPCGTEGFMAPEVLRGGMPSQKSDVSSLGVMLAKSVLQFPGTIDSFQYNHFGELKFPDESVKDRNSFALLALAKRMTRMDPESRPSCDDCLNSDVFRVRHSSMLSAPAGASGSSTSVATDFWKLVARTWDRQHETTHMTVNRETILEDLVREVFEKTLLEPYLVCGPWRVTFLNEDGIDAGGLELDCMSQFFESLSRSESFVKSSNGMVINGGLEAVDQSRLENFWTGVGAIMAHCVARLRMVPTSFLWIVFDQIFGRVPRLGVDDGKNMQEYLDSMRGPESIDLHNELAFYMRRFDPLHWNNIEQSVSVGPVSEEDHWQYAVDFGEDTWHGGELSEANVRAIKIYMVYCYLLKGSHPLAHALYQGISRQIWTPTS